MRKKLAIRGHATRGKEVIELLEMLGGKNNCDSIADNLGLCYLIDDEFDICAHYFGYDDYEDGELNIFTLEEFLYKYPFKVGDKVIDEADGYPGVVREMKWDEGVSDMKYYVAFGNGIDFGWFANDSINFFKNKKNENFEETQSKREYDELIMPIDDDDKLATEATIMGKKILPPNGYLIGKITQTDNGMLVEYVEKKPKYPDNYEECCDKIKFKGGFKDILLSDDEYSLYDSFIRLKRCRDAYWKIAGEEMGLGKPWKPDWDNLSTNHEFIKIDKGCFTYSSRVLVFPTEEMRDAFYDNFGELIESCKELL